ncbi:ganglioside GM2 activator-like [Littorina saxatilis]|uniref:MD-2-related lipid-recognition domain-containing protein n=1 Tax=Littorina saxatilis TaxID=31220 RepID=A0AAN9B5P3_9CAEN
MLGKILLVALLAACSANIFEDGLKKLSPLRNGVQHFAMNIPQEVKNEVDSKVGNKAQQLIQKVRSSLLLRGTPLGSFRPQQMLPLFGLLPPSNQKTSGSTPKSPLKLTSYNIVNCSAASAAKAKFVIKQLNISPDPVVLPGTINFQFDIDVLTDISALEAALDLRVKEGGQFIHVPCIGQFGSCSYDVCAMLQPVTACPPELVANKVPCHCPYNKGTYKVPGLSADISAEVFVPADYNATVKMTSNGEEVGCYTATFTIED